VRLVNFKSLSIKNFLSVGEVPVVINFQPGVNVITGINYDKEDSKNGVGKSTIVDALYFTLFGVTIREINKDLIVNSFTQKKCEAELLFETINNGATNTYTIKRTLSPTKCFLFKNGTDVTRSTLQKTNEHIQKIIQSTGKIFQNSVIMTINNTVPFMAQSKIDKRKFIESVLNLEIFSEMLAQARDEHNDLKKDYEILFTKIQTLEKNYTLNKQQLDFFEDNKKQKIEELDLKIKESQNKILNLKKEITTLPNNAEQLLLIKQQDLNKELKESEKKHREVYQKVTDIKTNIKHLEEQLLEINKVGSICTTCQRPYSENDIKHKEENSLNIKAKILSYFESKKSVDIELQNIDEQQSLKEKEINEIENKITKLRNLLNNNSNIETKINLINENIKETEQEKLKVELLTNTVLEKAVNDLQNELESGKVNLKKQDHNLNVLECVKFVVSEEGVKSYIVSKILKILNSRLAFYLEELQANCLCQFNEYFDEQITDEKGSVKSYFNFSGGERKRIDLACLFAFLDIRRMQGDVHFSTIFYDELLDSSLDDKGVELVIKILRERSLKHNEHCYIITHRANAIITEINNTLFLEKRNGFTYLLK
jgi:DNA repair exonuclease SbcCD ATPase subunit